MRALVIHEGGRLVVEDRPVPEPAADQVLVRVTGAGINRADLLQRAGRYPAPPGAPPDIPGLEFAGVVEAVGSAVSRPGTGDRVMGIVAGGAQAEYVLTAASHCARVPETRVATRHFRPHHRRPPARPRSGYATAQTRGGTP